LTQQTPEPNGEFLPARTDLRLLPTPSGRRLDLATIDDVRREMGKVYRDMKGKKIDTQDGTRLVYVLSQIGKLIEIQKITERVEALELVLSRRPKP
jgi:hypothetical protein